MADTVMLIEDSKRPGTFIGDYRTRSQALEDAKGLPRGSWYITNPSGGRSRKGTYDRPWILRMKPLQKDQAMTTTKLTMAEIKAIQKRADKAIPGKWVANDDVGAGLQIKAPVYKMPSVEMAEGAPVEPVQVFGFVERPFPEMPGLDHPLFSTFMYETWVQFEPKGWSEAQAANAEFIAHARTDVPRLCAQLIQREKDVVDLVNTVERLNNSSVALCQWLKSQTEWDGVLPDETFNEYVGYGDQAMTLLKRLREGG